MRKGLMLIVVSLLGFVPFKREGQEESDGSGLKVSFSGAGLTT